METYQLTMSYIRWLNFIQLCIELPENAREMSSERPREEVRKEGGREEGGREGGGGEGGRREREGGRES